MNILSDRLELLSILPKKAVCAEIGVAEGKFASEILKVTNPEKLILIDRWCDDEGNFDNCYGDWLNNHICPKFTDLDNVAIDISDSISASEHYPDNFFDWVYIDTTHDSRTLGEFEAWYPKIKNGGFLCGHDYFRPDRSLIGKTVEWVNDRDSSGFPPEWPHSNIEYENEVEWMRRWGCVRKAVDKMIDRGMEFKYLTNEGDGTEALSFTLLKNELGCKSSLLRK